jgi:LacI family transcriptional regulator
MTTIFEVAKKAGVSIGTVDRVIHNRGRVAPTTRDKIARIILESNYRPNVFASHLSQSRAYTFAVLTPFRSQDGRYWDLPLKGIRKAEKDLEAFRVNIRAFHFNKYSESSFLRAWNKILRLREEISGLVVAPVLARAAGKFIRQIPPNMPYVFIDSYIPNAGCLSCIGQNPFRSGKLAGKLMQMLTGNKGRVAIVRMLPQDYHLDDRVNGFLDSYTPREAAKLVIYSADRRKDGYIYYHLAPKILEEHPDVNGIFVPNSMGHQVAQYLKEKMPSRKIRIVAFDLIEANLPFVRDGGIDFIISQRPEIQGYQAIQYLYQHLSLKHSVPKTLMLPLDVITRENLDDYLGAL